ncbi:MAG: hypothetical protein QM764_21735 [Chitinophagaceae bacterium]
MSREYWHWDTTQPSRTVMRDVNETKKQQEITRLENEIEQHLRLYDARLNKNAVFEERKTLRTVIKSLRQELESLRNGISFKGGS